MESHPHKIGPVARELGVSLRTIRFYEEKKLISPKKTGTSRHFSDADLAKLRRLRELLSYGFSLRDAGKFLNVTPERQASLLRIRRDAMGIEVREAQEAFKLLDAEVESHGR